MKNIKEFHHKKILVVGLAKSGESAALLLHKIGAFVTVNDKKPLAQNQAAQGLLEQGIKVISGEHPIDLLDEGFEMIVKNPGIPYYNPLINGAIEKGIPVITEVELAGLISEAPFIGITGTNGKTTTTTLLFKMLEKGEKNPLIAGNIGIVASEVAQKATSSNNIVIELSSFQLMGIDKFKPEIAIITNIYEAHLDYHGNKENYARAKAAITKNQDENDFLIINFDQPELVERMSTSLAKIIPFSTSRVVEDGAYLKDGIVYFKEEAIMNKKDIVLPGDHNLENILSSIAAAKLKGVSNEAIISVLTTFTGVKHRTQFVKELSGRFFYNDSKATNTLATKSALRAFNQPTILLAGGLDRGNGFDDLMGSMVNVKTLVTFGQTAPKLIDMASRAGVKEIIHVKNVEEAVPQAYEASNAGDVILLSPSCASWDQYSTFEERGDIFIDEVNKLIVE
jgi:UDP-N-acetylmuramoylalanine--D-glutamate ligase